MAVAGGGVYLLARMAKGLVDRGRPAAILTGVEGRETFVEGSLGYPSGHAAVAAALTLVVTPYLAGQVAVGPDRPARHRPRRDGCTSGRISRSTSIGGAALGVSRRSGGQPDRRRPGARRGAGGAVRSGAGAVTGGDTRPGDARSARQARSATDRAAGAGTPTVAEPRTKKVLQILVSLVLLVAIFWYVFQQFADISEVWAAIQTLTWREIVVLVAVHRVNLFTYWIVIVMATPGHHLSAGGGAHPVDHGGGQFGAGRRRDRRRAHLHDPVVLGLLQVAGHRVDRRHRDLEQLGQAGHPDPRPRPARPAGPARGRPAGRRPARPGRLWSAPSCSSP